MMCRDCGCGEHGGREGQSKQIENRYTDLHRHTHSRHIDVRENVLAKNDALAEDNRRLLLSRQIVAINIMSSPGAGKTTLLQGTIRAMQSRLRMFVLTGDQERDFDARRLSGSGVEVRQINTHSACHLDAQMVADRLPDVVHRGTDLLFIENVGNLVCPASFDLGETKRVAMLSVTEGDDKPAKYPVLFHSADVIIINKTDLIPHVEWNRDRCVGYIREVNPAADLFFVSATTGDGLEGWYRYLDEVCRFSESSKLSPVGI